MKLRTYVVRTGRGNFSNSQKRADDGRKGRGADAFSPKMTDDWQVIMARVEQIASRTKGLGLISVNGPIHARHEWLKAVKF